MHCYALLGKVHVEVGNNGTQVYESLWLTRRMLSSELSPPPSVLYRSNWCQGSESVTMGGLDSTDVIAGDENDAFRRFGASAKLSITIGPGLPHG